jgi:hypothetical protein
VSIYDGKLEFDSDELGVHTFDFADIKELRSSRVLEVGFADRPPVKGRLVVASDAARVVAEAGETAFARSEILTIVVGAAREIDYTARLGTVRRRSRTEPASNTSATSPASTPRTRPTTTGSRSAGIAS